MIGPVTPVASPSSSIGCWRCRAGTSSQCSSASSSRTVPESDHEPGGTATVVGKYVRVGTAGRQSADGRRPPAPRQPEGLWAYAAAALRLTTAPFGRNPNPELIL